MKRRRILSAVFLTAMLVWIFNKETVHGEETKQPLSFSVVLQDETGQPVHGGIIEVEDEYGLRIDSWQTDAEAHLVQSENIREGSVCTIYASYIPEGYTAEQTKISYTVISDDSLIRLVCYSEGYESRRMMKLRKARKALLVGGGMFLVSVVLFAMACQESGQMQDPANKMEDK